MSLTSLKFTHDLARALKAIDQLPNKSGMPSGSQVRGTVVDVNDKENRGRVRVVFDAMNPEDIPQVEGAGEFSNSREGLNTSFSHWIDVSPSFTGQQPPGLVGKRVTIGLSNGQYTYAVLDDVVFDPQNLTESSASKLRKPDNSSMTRLPCYPSGSLPPATSENVGCTIVELGGPQGDDWLMVCLKRGGNYKWVRHIDRLHYHTGQLPDRDNDSEGNGPDTSTEKRTYDDVIQTTASPIEGSD
jgi:hypothetical protein